MGNSLTCIRHQKTKRPRPGDCKTSPSYRVMMESDPTSTTITTMNGSGDANGNGKGKSNGVERMNDPSSSAPVSQSNRNFNFVTLNTIRFAVPLGYSMSVEYLGGGSYGNVIKSKMTSRDGADRVVAIKKLHLPFNNVHNARRAYRELRLLQMMRHDNVIRAVDLYSPDTRLDFFKDVYIVTEFAGNSLHQILKSQRENLTRIISEEHAKFLIYQLLRAVKYIHSANVMHRDLKPGNLAVTQSCDLTVLDFGLARTLARNNTALSTYVMTRWYRSPEVIYWKINSYDTQADIWSVGCIAAELMTTHILFPGDSNAQYDMITRLCGSPDAILLAKIEASNGMAMRQVIATSHPDRPRQDFYEYFHGLPVVAIDFLDKMLVLDPERRMSVDEALRHEYVKEYHQDDDEPVAPEPFTLDDEGERRTLEQWKEVIWEEIQNFSGDEHSPVFQ